MQEARLSLQIHDIYGNCVEKQVDKDAPVVRDFIEHVTKELGEKRHEIQNLVVCLRLDFRIPPETLTFLDSELKNGPHFEEIIRSLEDCHEVKTEYARGVWYELWRTMRIAGRREWAFEFIGERRAF